MTLPANTHWIAAMAFERMLYCLAEGTALAAVMSLVLRLVPGKNSRTRFAVWFATLAAVALLPVVEMGVAMGTGIGFSEVGRSGHSPRALLTISTSWAASIILGWALLASVGLLRVAAGLWQIRRLRRGCLELDPQALGPELQALIEEFRTRRPVSILVSPSLGVPTAIGFLRPAVLIPAWLAQDSAAEELKYVLLHELAHLRRWDDWTNLAQKLVKAVLFFHPGVWWIERKLSLDREMACDDAVLAQTASPRVYAKCLARVAENSFRRHMALAQAAVDRMRQLSLRVTRILDGDRPRSTRLWKPAIPMVIAAALVCAVSTSSTPELVRLSDDQPAQAPMLAGSSSSSSQAPMVKSSDAHPVIDRGSAAAVGKSAPLVVNMAKFTPASPTAHTAPKAWQASLQSQAGPNSLVPAHYSPAKHVSRPNEVISHGRKTEPQSPNSRSATTASARYQGSDSESEAQQGDVVFLVVASERITSAGSVTWQISAWELRVVAPAVHPPKQIPRKT